MAKKRKKKKVNKTSFFDDIAPQTKQAIAAIGFVVFGIFLIASLLGTAGSAGEFTNKALRFLFGWGAFIAPVICFLYVYVLLRPRDNESVSTSKTVGVILLFFALLGIFSLIDSNDSFLISNGGAIGYSIAMPFEYFLGKMISGVSLGALIIIGIFLTFNTHRLFPKIGGKKENEEEADEDILLNPNSVEQEKENEEEGEGETSEVTEEEEKPKRKNLRDKIGLGASNNGFEVSNFSGPYDPPPLSLLLKDRGKAKVGDVKANANIIKRTLKNFNIEVEMDEVSIGSSVTRYAIKPAEGVRISKIVSLQNNLELALASSPIRIEAPIPGKSLVGIEVPNTSKTTVGLASVLTSPEYTDSSKPLIVALGRDIVGHAHFADVEEMPHALIAGSTNAGKSVTIHNLIVSLLFRNSPEQLRFIMIDPKRVELTLYNGIPHLLTPVIINAKTSILSLKWTIKEMERRYEIFETEKIQNLSSYHKDIYHPAKEKFEKSGSPEDEKDDLPEPLPHIVIVIDELSDLMQAYPRELEALIVRLTQKSRAVGIHLIIATQRPEVKVITGLIKANIPYRIALRVNSVIDSRTILDKAGAEKLLGYGDMLFLSPSSDKPFRLQSAFVTTDEIKKIVSYLKKQNSVQELDSITLESSASNGSSDAFFASTIDDEDEDDLYDSAKVVVIEAGKASTSYLQRKLRVGYSRAARLMDMLEERGVISPANGSKPREILENEADNEEYSDEKEDDN